MPKKQSSSNDAAVDQVMTLAFKVDTAKPGDVVFISPARPLDTKAMQHLNAKFKAANLGVKVVVLQYGVRVAHIAPGADEIAAAGPSESERIATENAG